VSETDATTTGPSPVRWWWLLLAPLLAVLLVLAGVIAIATIKSDGGEAGDARGAATAPLELASVSDDVADHYRYAETHRADFSSIPCFCGCEEFLAHENLYDCFIRTDGAGYDSHAAGCGVCVGEAALAADLLDGSTPPAEVAARIVEQFGTTPVTSPDQTIPRP
jgi:hypothetical protein